MNEKCKDRVKQAFKSRMEEDKEIIQQIAEEWADFRINEYGEGD